jgi:hypothetical protein
MMFPLPSSTESPMIAVGWIEFMKAPFVESLFEPKSSRFT